MWRKVPVVPGGVGMTSNSLLKAAFVAVMCISMAIGAPAASVKVLYTFQGGASGQNPRTPLAIDSSGNMYGLAGNSSNTIVNVYELSPLPGGAWSYRVIYKFPSFLESNSGLILDSAGNLYGTTFNGGTYGLGTAFELTRSSGGTWTEAKVYNFGAPSDGTNPQGTLVFGASGVLYGTTFKGGTSNNGTVFELVPQTDGTWAETILYSFAGEPDGAWPAGPLVFDAAGNLYGTTSTGGNYQLSQCYLSGYAGCGTVYELSPQSNGSWTETVLHNFTGCCLNNNHDGQNPYYGVIFGPEGKLYGATQNGGGCNAGCGIAFDLGLEETGWKESVLATFGQEGNGDSPTGLILGQNGNLYGTTVFGGDSNGTIFALNRGSKGYHEKVIYSFTGGSDGSVPESIVFGPGGKFYGVAFWGGNQFEGAGDGTIFEATP
jgi:uncharacterized repeat protein (TIGR03803 family)